MEYSNNNQGNLKISIHTDINVKYLMTHQLEQGATFSHGLLLACHYLSSVHEAPSVLRHRRIGLFVSLPAERTKTLFTSCVKMR